MVELKTERILAETDAEHGIGWLVLNNPQRLNALSLDMWEGIPAVLDAFEADPAVRVIVLRGQGEHFATGADISEFEAARNSPEDTERYDDTTDVATGRLEACPKPTIAMIDGYCIGGAVSIVIACDLRIASDVARFGVPAGRLGVGYRTHGVKKLMDVVGPAFTKEIFFTARQFSAEEALAMGWVNRVVPPAHLETAVRELAGSMAENAPLTLRAVNTAVRELGKDASKRDLETAQRLVAECFASEDYAEGRRAFMEKRRPVFQGR